MLKTLSCLFLLSSPAFAGNLDAPIVGGKPATAGEFPDVALVAAPNALCTGTLIAPDLVLTAGHCIDTKPTDVVIGTVDYAKPGGEKIAIKRAVAYPDWQHKYDVGILELASPSKAKPRAIAGACTVREHLKAGAEVTVVGFGLTDTKGTGKNTLLHAAQMPVDDATCKGNQACRMHGGEFTTGGKGTESCFGDSGGPVFADAMKDAGLLGIVSRGIGSSAEPCGGANVDVRADKVVHWIEKETKKKLTRSACDKKQDGEPGDEQADDGEEGGCSAGGLAGGGSAALVALGAMLGARRRREAKQR